MKFLVVFFLFFCSTLYGQKNKIDSLYTLIKKSKEDSLKCKILDQISWEYKTLGKLDSALFYGNQTLRLATKLNFTIGIANAHEKIGNVYDLQGNYPKSLQNYYKTLEIAEKLKNKKSLAAIYGNIGNVYYRQNDFKKTLEFYHKALKMSEKLGFKTEQAIWLNNIGLVYADNKDFDKALISYDKSSKLFTELNHKFGLINVFGNIGILYEAKSEYKKAIDFFAKELKISMEIGDKYGICASYGNMGGLYIKLKSYAIAEEYLLKALKIGKELGYLETIKEWNFNLSDLYVNKENYKKAYQYYKDFVIVKDSMLSEQSRKQILEMSTKYETEKKEQQIKLLRIDKEKQEILTLSQKKRSQTILFSVISGLILVVIFSIFITKRYRITQRQKQIIEKQKHEVEIQKELVEEKNREILDSITYAKRIQSAILPQPKLVKEYFRDSFILYKPKDIVAGDFYWFEVIDNTIFFAAADCTGHGVPGAMVSVVCHNALNRSVKEYNLKNPNQILDKTREIVVAEFEKSDEDVKDGMDISLAALRVRAQSEIQSKKESESEVDSSLSFSPVTLLWSGAHNPLWILRNNEIIEYKGDKQPIGKFAYSKPFKNHEIELQDNDEIYIFTDGFQDQFGGPTAETGGKKFKVSQMRELLLSMANETMEEKRMKIDEAFETWKGDLDQVDDVCVIGVRI